MRYNERANECFLRFLSLQKYEEKVLFATLTFRRMFQIKKKNENHVAMKEKIQKVTRKK